MNMERFLETMVMGLIALYFILLVVLTVHT